MVIALIADDKKKELLNQFCIAYCGILSKQKIYATGKTGLIISESTGLEIECVMPGTHGGVQQIASRVSYDEIDLVIYFRDSVEEYDRKDTFLELLRLCDIHNIPVATNIATAEVMIHGVERGDIEWRELINPKSEYNIHRKQIEERQREKSDKERMRVKRDAAKLRRHTKKAAELGMSLDEYRASLHSRKKQDDLA